MDSSYKYFSNRDCEYFPCHEGADPDDFNCLFCYCPLYFLGEKCGGNFRFTKKGIKDCTGCLIPHKKANFSLITSKLKKVIHSKEKCIVELAHSAEMPQDDNCPPDTENSQK